MINEIALAFPHRFTTSELSQRLGVTARRLQMICREAFGKPLHPSHAPHFGYQALNMMKKTNLDNTEIALELNYGDESSLTRIFRKGLGYNATEAPQTINEAQSRRITVLKDLPIYYSPTQKIISLLV